MAKARIVRLARWVLAVVALAFVAWVVPVRDHCWDPRSPASTRVSVSHEDATPAPSPQRGPDRAERGGSCVLHLRTGDVPIDAVQCAQLACEPGVASTFAHARGGVLAALLVLYALGTLAWAARWRALLGFAGVDLSLSQVWRVSIEAQAGGILLPGGIGGDALRIASVAARSPLSVVVASVLLDRAVGLAVVAGMAAALAFACGGWKHGVGQVGPLAWVLAGIPVAFVVAAVVLRRAPLARFRWLVEGRVGELARPLLEYGRDPRAPRAVAEAAALSVLVAAVQFATIRGFIFALGGVPLAEKWVYMGTAMAFVVSALPALPGAWGTADAAYVFFLGLAGLRPGTALAVCLLFRLFWYLSAAAGAILHLMGPRPAAAPAGAGPG
jgi:glycosyltransferase 2 family protein